jgi:hypothetical protein
LKYRALDDPSRKRAADFDSGTYDDHQEGRKCTTKVEHFSQILDVTCPSLSSVSILLTFVLKGEIQTPPHLPPSRALADSSQRFGPTKEDIDAFRRWATPPLLADTLTAQIARGSEPSQRFTRSMMHDQDFDRILQSVGTTEYICRSEMSRYKPGMLTGLWQGSSTSEHSKQTQPVRRPLQCRLNEHLCYCPNTPLPSTDDGASSDWSILPGQLLQHQVRLKAPAIWTTCSCLARMGLKSRI